MMQSERHHTSHALGTQCIDPIYLAIGIVQSDHFKKANSISNFASPTTPFDAATDAGMLIGACWSTCKNSGDGHLKFVASHRDGTSRPTPIKAASIGEQMVSVIEKKIWCACGLEITGNLLGCIEAVGKTILSRASLFSHPLRCIFGIRNRIVTRYAYDSKSAG